MLLEIITLINRLISHLPVYKLFLNLINSFIEKQNWSAHCHFSLQCGQIYVHLSIFFNIYIYKPYFTQKYTSTIVTSISLVGTEPSSCLYSVKIIYAVIGFGLFWFTCDVVTKGTKVLNQPAPLCLLWLGLLHVTTFKLVTFLNTTLPPLLP